MSTSVAPDSANERQVVTPQSYRERVYGRYVSAFKGQPTRDERLPVIAKRMRVLDHWLGPLLKSHEIHDLLEVACGQGDILYWAQQRGIKNAHGCDLSAEQVAVAKALGVSAEKASFQDYLPRFQNSCDLIIAVDVIEHLSRDEAFELLDLCRGALRPQGLLVLTTPNGAAYRSGPVHFGDLTHETIFSPESISVALRLAGFTCIQVNEIPPPPTSWKSRIRGRLWQFVRLWPLFVDLVETGGCSTKVLTRVMSVQANCEDRSLRVFANE